MSDTDTIFAQHDHESSSSGSESGNAGSIVGLDGHQALVALSEIGNCYGCNNNTNSQSLTIFKHATEDLPFLKGGTMFMISPNPYAFTNFSDSANPQFFGPNLIISDNDPLDYDPTMGVIELIRVNPGVYSVWELRGPSGLMKNNAPHSSAEVAVSSYPQVPVTNLFLDLSSGPQFVLPPPFPISNLDVMKGYNPLVGGKSLTYLPSSVITSKNTMYSVLPPNHVIFEKILSNVANSWDISERFSNLGIPNYGDLSTGNSDGVYIPPIIVGQNIDGSNFLTTPKFSSVDFNTNFLIRLDSIVQYGDHHGTHGSSLFGIYLPLAVSGTDFGISLQINDEPPGTIPDLNPADGFQTLFFDVKSDGDINLNSPGSFTENPTINFFLDRNLDNSCMSASTVKVFLYDSGQWHPVKIKGAESPPQLIPALHTATQCAYEQEVEHFSTFLIATSTKPADHSGHGGSHSGHDSNDHENHDVISSFALADCTVSGLVQDIYNKNVYLQVHTNSDGNIDTNSGPGDFYNPGEARGQIQYVYGSKLFTTVAKPGNEILSSQAQSMLWGKSKATVNAIFDSSKFNELKYTISGKNISNVVGVSLYLGDQYENSDIRLVDIIPLDSNSIHKNFDFIQGTITNKDMCLISQDVSHVMSHGNLNNQTADEGNISHDSHLIDEIGGESIISPEDHANHNSDSQNPLDSCSGTKCVEADSRGILGINDSAYELPVTMMVRDTSSPDSEFDFGNSFSGKRVLVNLFGKTFPITYNLDGKLTKMTINEQRHSLSLYLDGVKEGKFSIRVPKEMIDAENNNFLVMITASPEQIAEYDIISSDDSFFIMQLIIPENTSKITLIGTKVIPEFGSIAALILILGIIGTIVLASKRKNLSILYRI